MIALDSTAIIDIFKNDEGIKRIIGECNDEIGTTLINYQEVFFGLNPIVKKHQDEIDFYEKFFEGVILLGFEQDSARKASEIFFNLKDKGKEIGKFDCMIAGILLSNNVNKIITKNRKDFEGIQGLEIIQY